MRNFCLLFITVLLTSFSAFSQKGNDPCDRTALMIRMLNKYHYQPVELNDSVSAQIYSDFINTLDPYSLFFTEVELKQLEQYKYVIDDYSVNEKSCEFLKLATTLFKERLIKVDTMVGSILSKPFDFNAKDTITFVSKNAKITSENDLQLEKRWKKRLKFKALEMMFTASDENENISLADNKTLLLKEPEIRKKLRAKEKRFAKRILDYPMGFDNYVSVAFHNTIANRFDPHTLYFSTLEKENFDAGLSKEAKSFGLTIEEGKNGEITIGSLTPGGPAWKSSELHKGDVILKIKWPDSDPVDLSYADPSEVYSMIHSSTSDKIELTIQQANGMISTVQLYREVISVDENMITGFVLKGEKKVGYIALPGFYTDMASSRALGCANDVAKEILKLKEENIDGLLLDLRFNGGGSLYEAVNLAGIFIDEGPLCLIRDKETKPQLIKDINRGTVYNGPLIIMVNGLSASASEIFSCGMKDYNRALIVGSNTYGKSIGQVTLPIDTTVDADKATDFINVTRSKFYGIDGISHQFNGVKPDIIIPDFYNNSLYGEIASPYALKSDTVIKKVFFNPQPALPKTDLNEKSKARLNATGNFNRIRSVADSLHNLAGKNQKIPLTLDSFRKYQLTEDKTEEEITNLVYKPTEKYQVSSAQFDDEVLKADTYKREMNDILIKNIINDIYIEESYMIMNDLINQTNK